MPIARDIITDNPSHEDSTLDDNDEYEPRGQQTSLDDVPQLISQVQTCHQTGEEEEAKPTKRKIGVWRDKMRQTKILLMTGTRE